MQFVKILVKLQREVEEKKVHIQLCKIKSRSVRKSRLSVKIQVIVQECVTLLDPGVPDVCGEEQVWVREDAPRGSAGGV